MARRAAVALALAAATLAGAEGKAGCVAYEDVLEDGGMGFCAGIVDYEFYAADVDVPQSALDKAAWGQVTGEDEAAAAVLQKLLLLLPGECSAVLKRAACLAVFPRCEWVQPYLATPPPDVTVPNSVAFAPIPDEACLTSGLTVVNGNCMAPLPRFPCRAATCEDPVVLSRSASRQCPLISGYFNAALAGALAEGSGVYKENERVRAEFAAILDEQGCANPALEICRTKVYTVNMLTVFGFEPDCNAKTVTQLGEIDVFPVESTLAVQGLLAANIAQLQDPESCGVDAAGNPVTCATVLTYADCGAPPAKPPTVQATYDIADKNSMCSDVTRSDTNQDGTLMHLLSLRDGAYNPDKFAQCFSTHKTDLYKGLYYVPGYPGAPPLAPRLDSGSNQRPREDWNTDACPNRAESVTRFASLEGAPLCRTESRGSTIEGYNARDCLEDTISSTTTAFPTFAPYRCRAAFLDMACSQAQMKVQTRTLCLVDGGCEVINATLAFERNRVGFTFALPRFASRDMCFKYKSECSALFAASPQLDIDCEASLDINTCSNGDLNVWGCSNPLNGLPVYPKDRQVFADASAIPAFALYSELSGIPLESLSAAFTSDVVKPTISEALYRNADRDEIKQVQEEFCECPFPLVVPDNPDPDGSALINNSTCCALPCRGSMHTPEDMDLFGSLQLVLSSLGLVCSGFMVLTWGIFEAKRKQFMTFWLAFCAFNVSLGFFLMAITSGNGLGSTEPNLCRDNSEPSSLQLGFDMCTFQAIWLVFFASAECGWWAVQSADLFRKLVLGKRKTEDTKFKYHVFAWTVPTIATSILLATRSFGYRAPTPYCLLIKEAGSLMEWLFFYLFIALCFLAGTIMIFSVLAVIIRHANRGQAGSSGTRFRARYRMYRTPMLFALLFIFVWLNIFSFRLLVSVNQDAYEKQGVAWVRCLLGNYLAGIENPATDPRANTDGLIDPPEGIVGCGLTQGGIPRTSLMLTFVVAMSQAILIFVVFGPQPDNYRLWLEFFGCREPTERDMRTEKTSKDTLQNTSQIQMGNGSTFYGSKAESSYAGGGSSFSPAPAPQRNYFGSPPPPPPPGRY